MLSDSDERIKVSHKPLMDSLLLWFEANKRLLPWRETYEPYSVWVSEIMLQQTQMERGVEYYIRWMERFPTIESVASAPLDEVFKLWEGLGYYSRAKNLHKTAKIITESFKGTFPSEYKLLRSLPGVGDYTAGAIAAIAFNQPIPAVDANVERVFSRLFDIAVPCKSTVARGFIRQMAEAIIPEGKARECIQAIMELGALLCKKKPLCEVCPISKFCQAYTLGITEDRPVINKKINYTSLLVVTGVLVHKGCIFIQKRLDTGAWAGLWEFPGGRLEEGETPEQGAIREMLEETSFVTISTESLGIIKHSYTKYKVTLHCFLLELAEKYLEDTPPPILQAASEYCWVLPEDLDKYAMPAGHRKLLETKKKQIFRATMADK